MVVKRILLLLAVLGYISAGSGSAQSRSGGFDFFFLAGDNIGATTPVPIPGALNITGYKLKFNPKLGANAAYYFDSHWGVGAGLTLDWKGMSIRTKVTEVHLAIDVPQLGTLTGNVTGRNKTRVNALYLTQPVYASYRFNYHWQVKAGIYLAETLSRKFKGSVSEVDIVVETPVSQEREVPYATLDYSGDVRKLDVGMLAGGEYRLNRNIGFFADFTWGLTPYFSSEVPIHFTMRNIYLSVGMTFRVNAGR